MMNKTLDTYYDNKIPGRKEYEEDTVDDQIIARVVFENKRKEQEKTGQETGEESMMIRKSNMQQMEGGQDDNNRSNLYKEGHY